MARRTIWSVLAAALLCLVMLPATAWAADYAPEELIVANVVVDVTKDGAWTTDAATGELTETQDAAVCNVRYDADEGALYLSDATIGKGTVSTPGGTYSIYAFGESGVSLTIHLAGESHLSSGVPIYVTSDTGNTELNIEGDGKLNAEGTAWGNGGIFLNSGAKMTTGGGSYLNITDGADVVSSCSNSTAVMFYARPGGEAILTVMGARLTANGWSPTGDARGIFFSRLDGTGTAKFYLRLADNAVVRTNKVAVLSGHTLQHQYNSASGGMLFNGDAGTVYGAVTLQEDLSIGEDETLTIYQGASLTIPEGVSLINEGTVTGAGGSIVNNGAIYNSGKLPENISGSGSQIEIPTYTLNCPDEVVLENHGGGKYQAQFDLSLEDDPILGEGGKVVVYGTYRKADMVLKNEGDARQTIPFTIGAYKNNVEGSYFETDNQVKVLAVLDSASADSYSVEVLCEQPLCAEVANGTYSGAFDLYVGYAEDDDVQFGDDVSGADLGELDRHTVKVTFQNESGFAFTVQPEDVAVTEGDTASFSADWTGDVYLFVWQQRADDSSKWEDISGAYDGTYSVANTTVDMDGYQFRCLVMLQNDVQIPSDVATLTVRVKTAITTQPVDANVIEGDAATFTVEATGSGDLSYRWQQSADGTAWTDIPGATSASYTVPAATMEMDGYQYRCVVIGDGGEAASNAATLSVTAAVFKISASPEVLDFGSVYVGYDVPAAQTVTVENGGNKNVTLVQLSSADFEIGALSATELAPGDTATFTVQPKEGLGVGAHNEDLAVAASDGAAARVELSFTVRSRPYIPPASSGPDWDDVVDDISSAKPGDCVSVDMDGETVLPAEVIEALAGRDVTLMLEMEDDVAWEIRGADVPEGTSFSDTDMGVELGTSGIPVEVVNLVAGESGSVQVTLAHDGEFGFALTLVAPLGEKHEGLVANLYRYDEAAGVLRYEAAGVVDGGGAARVRLDRASRWAIVLDDRPHALPFVDASEGRWYSEPARWAWLSGAMGGYGDGVFGTGDPLTRAQMAAVLYNLAGKPEVDASSLPADCDADEWYARAVAWALEEGVFGGYGDGSSFGPGDPLTREQAAAVLYNAAGKPEAETGLSSFSDAAEVSSWARSALSWAVSEGVLSGAALAGGSRELQPGRACTQAEVAALMMKLARRG